eukprot:14666699-Alexandrium_andersonii.AAC.1
MARAMMRGTLCEAVRSGMEALHQPLCHRNKLEAGCQRVCDGEFGQSAALDELYELVAGQGAGGASEHGESMMLCLVTAAVEQRECPGNATARLLL